MSEYLPPVLPVEFWYNSIVKERTRPSELGPLMGLLYGRPGAEDAWEEHQRKMDAWRERWRGGMLPQTNPTESAISARKLSSQRRLGWYRSKQSGLRPHPEGQDG